MERDETIEAILFDFGGVIAEEGFRNGLRELAEEQGLVVDSMTQVGADAVYDSGFVLGQGKAADFWDLMRRRSGLAGEDETLTQHILQGFVVRPWMIEIVKQLREVGYVTGILSDQTNWLDILDRQYHFYQYFEPVYNSFRMGKGKRDPSLFADIAKDLGVAPQSILFVDDDYGNIARASAMQFKTILFEDKARFVQALSDLTGITFI